MYQYLLESKVGEIFWISGAEFACPPMLPPEYFDNLVVKYDKELIDLIHDYGKKTMIHCHGKIAKVLNGIADIGMDSLHPIEPPPMGDCTLTQARNALKKQTILAGNIQYGGLWSKSEEEMEYIVMGTIREGVKGPFILATTGGPSAPEINEKVAKNYLRIIETALNFKI